MKKTALVTGGNRGIGLAIVEGLADKGFEVLLGCRDLIAGVEVAKSLGPNVKPVQLDLSHRVQLLPQLKEISTTYGNLDVLVNNAGVLHEGGLLDVPAEQFYESMQVNSLSVFDLMQHFVPGMIEQGYGRIVNVSSGWGAVSDGLTGPAAYSASKATLNALTIILAQQLKGDVKVNAMCPGWVRTRMGGMAATRSPEKGAETAIWLATLPGKGPNGGFFRDMEAIDL